MSKIQMIEDHLLVQKVEIKESQFEMVGTVDKRGAVYKVRHSFKGCRFEKGDTVMLNPRVYEGLYFEDELFTVIKEGDIIARILEDKK